MRRAVIAAAATLSVLAACTYAPDTSSTGASTATPPTQRIDPPTPRSLLR